jgi:hypothetical protein
VILSVMMRWLLTRLSLNIGIFGLAECEHVVLLAAPPKPIGLFCWTPAAARQRPFDKLRVTAFGGAAGKPTTASGASRETWYKIRSRLTLTNLPVNPARLAEPWLHRTRHGEIAAGVRRAACRQTPLSKIDILLDAALRWWYRGDSCLKKELGRSDSPRSAPAATGRPRRSLLQRWHKSSL